MKYQIHDLLGIVLNAYGMCINYLNDWLTCNYSETRMHSSRMRTVRNSSRLLLGGLHTPPREQAPWEQAPPGAGTPQEQAAPRAGTPPGADPPGAGTPLCCKACWDTTCNAFWDSTPPCEQND